MSRTQQGAIETPGAWLTTVASRICLDLLGTARVRRARYVGEWVPEPVPDPTEWITGPSGGIADPAATGVADGGGLATAKPYPIVGAEQMARACLDIVRRNPDISLLERTVNGQPGLVDQRDSVIVTVFAFHIAGDRIRHIWAVRNPEKLRAWATT
jgi:hypothetical protein